MVSSVQGTRFQACGIGYMVSKVGVPGFKSTAT